MKTTRNSNQNIKVCRVATVPFALLSYAEHLELLQKSNIDVTVVASQDQNFELLSKLKISRVIAINICRDINIFHDLLSLVKLFLFFRSEKFDVIHSNTPKAGLLVSIAGYLTSSNVIHTFTGQRWQTLSGLKRFILIACDKLIVKLNKKSYCDSPSQRDFLISCGIGSSKSLFCLKKGSFAGVNLERFNNERFTFSRSEIAKEVGINEGCFIISYVGRIVKDKGIIELLDAFKRQSLKIPNLALLLIGPTNDLEMEIGHEYASYIKESSNIYCTGYTNQPEKYLSISSVFCLPSYREGFGTVVIEAAAMGIPTIGTDIVGLKDAILHMETGILVTAHDTDSLESAISKIYHDDTLRNKLGKNALINVKENYSHIHLTNAYVEEYQNLCL